MPTRIRSAVYLGVAVHGALAEAAGGGRAAEFMPVRGLGDEQLPIGVPNRRVAKSRSRYIIFDMYLRDATSTML
jgi:hypothetical protein